MGKIADAMNDDNNNSRDESNYPFSSSKPEILNGRSQGFSFHHNNDIIEKYQFPHHKVYFMPPSRHHNQSLMTKILSSLSSDLGIVIIIALFLLAVYLIDTVTPLGEPVWMLYFIPLILSYWSGRYYAIPAVCIVTLIFLVGGFLFSPEGLAITQAALYRFTFFLVFISVSIILWMIRRKQITEERL
jgi:hypothetical protein